MVKRWGLPATGGKRAASGSEGESDAGAALHDMVAGQWTRSKAVSMIASFNEYKKVIAFQRCRDDKIGTMESMSGGVFAAKHTRCAHTPKSLRSLALPR
jgi:hypothetical protein